MSEPLQILVVDDDKSIGQLLHSVLSAEGYTCHITHNDSDAETVLHQRPIDLALVDIYLDQANGLDFLERVKALQPQCDCVVMTANASVETVARSVAEGAVEYLGKPLLIDDLLALVRRLESRRRSRVREADFSAEEGFPDSAIVGRSPKMIEVYRAIARVAPGTATVLITGPSGTGKELVARAIHTHSSRAHKPFTPVNCGSLTETLLESELFGHEKGAFTGADTSRRGLFEATHGGSLFLDEISETSLGFQVKLLRVLQDHQIRRLGSTTYTPIDVRILAATNRDLNELIEKGVFREDLYYRLSVVTIQLPSLEERREDIPLLVRHFLGRFNQRNTTRVAIAEEAVRLLGSRPWPGNVRELENTVERLAIFCTSNAITAEDVERLTARERAVSAAAAGGAQHALAATLLEMERQHILRALREAEGNKSLAARRLGIERKTLYKKARRLGIDLEAKEQS